MELREIPIVARRIELHPHPGSGRFGDCAPCLFGSPKRYSRSVVIVYTTFAHDDRPSIHGECANHAELLKPIDTTH